MKNEILAPAFNEFEIIGQGAVKYIPYVISALVIFAVFFTIAYLFKKLLKNRLQRKGQNPLVIRAITNISFFVILGLGAYLSLRTGGLSGLAFTLIGGTGVIGIALGFALKGTFENYIAGLILGLRKVFRTGDIVEVAGHQGIVQAVNSRSTLLMDWEGNNISIPNSDVYSNVIKNLTNNPKMRSDFTVGIGYEDSIDQAREVILQVFQNHKDKFLQDPAPIVAADGLGSATVNLRVYFWFNAVEFSIIKIRSLAVQLVKEALMNANVSMPDDAREIVFANPLEITRQKAVKKSNIPISDDSNPAKDNYTTSMDITNEADDIRRQLKDSRPMEKGENLLNS